MSKVTLDNFSDGLKAYLNNVVTTSTEMIGDITNLDTTEKSTVTGAINELVQICNFLLVRTADSFAIVDITEENVVTDGSKVVDKYASNGYCYRATAGSSNLCLFSADFSEVKYGNYALCARLKTTTTTSSNVVKISILNNGTEIASKTFAGSAFDSTSNYSYLYTSFNYQGDGKEKTNLSVKIEVLPVNGVQISFDYAYISMIMPSVFL